MKFVGYYRVPPAPGVFFSPAQEERLLLLGCEQVFSDRCHATGVIRPGLERALAALPSGGTLAVPSFHALAGTLVDLLDFVGKLKARGLDLVVVQPELDTRVDPTLLDAWLALAAFEGERRMVRLAEAALKAKGAPASNTNEKSDQKL